jgi:hypothetical protein
MIRFKVSLDDGEYAFAKKEAMSVGISVAEFIRCAVRDKLPASAIIGRDRLAIRRILLVLALSAYAFVSGCRDVASIWSTESRSPDGQWIAVARTDQYGGPGTAGLQTTVSLKRAKGPKSTIEILALSQNAASINLKMNWLTPSHLEITYEQPASVDFQAIKCGGVDISVQGLSSAPSNTPAQ